jgi:hypothetical protein
MTCIYFYYSVFHRWVFGPFGITSPALAAGLIRVLSGFQGL